MAFETHRGVEWGDCDPAGIAFYPAFFRWMDAAFHEMTADLGWRQADLADHGLFGTPLIEAGARFRAPVRPGDALTVRVSVTRLGRTSAALRYGFARGETAVAQGTEARAFVAQGPDGGLAPAAMPDAIRDGLSRHVEAATDG